MSAARTHETMYRMGTSTDNVTNRLREKILEGAFSPGEPLRQVQLSESMGISRTPLRTALANLANERLLDYEPNRGYSVRQFNMRDILSAYDVRAWLEGMACYEAARRGMTAETLDHLEDLLATGDRILAKPTLEEPDLVPYRQMNVDFHDSIIAAADNRWLTDFVRQSHNVPLTSNRLIVWSDREIIWRSHDDHHRILTAIRERDPGRADAVMREHVTFAGRYLVENAEAFGLRAPWKG